MPVKSNPNIEEHIKNLTHPDSSKRVEAAEALREMGPSAVSAIPHLIENLKDEDKLVKITVAMALRDIYNVGVIGDFIGHKLVLQVDKYQERGALALSGIGDHTDVPALIEKLNDENNDVRSLVAGILGEIGDISAVGPLIESLKDEDSLVRSYAAISLGDLGDGRAVNPLIESLKDEDDYVGGRAATALGKIGHLDAVDPLIKSLKYEGHSVKWNAAGALGSLGDGRAVNPLIESLKDEIWVMGVLLIL